MKNYKFSLRILVVTLSVGLFVSPWASSASERERPFIWVTAEERSAILDKIESQPWASEMFQTLRARADAATAETLAERRARLTELPLVWRDGENMAPVLRSYAKESRGQGPKSDDDFRFGYPRDPQHAMFKGIQDGVDCSVLYYLTQEQAYAQCAGDMLATFVNALAKMEVVDTGFMNGGWIYQQDHLLEARLIGAQIPIIYDFVYPYLERGGKVYDLASSGLKEFDFEAAQTVFETYASLAVNRGLHDSNWPVLEGSSLLHNILALDSAGERAEKLQFVLSRDTAHQASLSTVAEMYKKPGDVWPESMNYSRHVTYLSIYLMTALDRLYPGLKLGQKYPNIPEALKATYDLQFPNDDYPFIGDGHRHYEVEYPYYEIALQLAQLNGNKKQEKYLNDFLAASLSAGEYNRAHLPERHYPPSPYLLPLRLLWPQPEIKGGENVNLQPERPRTHRLNHAGLTLQRIVSDEKPVEDSLMAFTAGGSYIHGHASGMDMELYGQGYVLGIDGGKGTYRTAIHENYYRLFAAHNTVISNGASASTGGWINLGINQVQVENIEPAIGEPGVSSRHSFATTSFIDEHNLVAPAEHLRTLALIKLSESRGYYLDIFRARSEAKDQFHDYVYHNLGDSLEITSAGKRLRLKDDPERYQASAQLPWEFHEGYQHPGWHYFEDVRSGRAPNSAYEATFTASKLAESPIMMRAVVPAGGGAEITQVIAPKAYGAAKPYNNLPLPTFLLRKQGEAWDNPFAVTFESYRDTAAIRSVERLTDQGKFKGVKVQSEVDGESIAQYVLVQDAIDDVYQDETLGINFQGLFAVVTVDKHGTLKDAYIGSGHRLQYRDVVINADEASQAAYFEQ